MNTDHGHHEHPKGLRLANTICAFGTLLLSIVSFALTYGEQSSILGFIIGNLWVLLNIAFLFLPHH